MTMSRGEFNQFIENGKYDIYGKGLFGDEKERRVQNEKAKIRRKLRSLYGYNVCRINWQLVDRKEQRWKQMN